MSKKSEELSGAISREALLSILESVQPGLAQREIVEQGSCFVFMGEDGRVWTYNDEIACSCESPLNITGAVQAQPLLDVLRKMNEETIKFKVADGELIITGAMKQVGVRMEAEVLLPVADIELPSDDDWKELPKKFCEAIGLVERCAARDESTFALACVHIHPKHIEAYDNIQMGRYKLKMPVSEHILIRRNSIKHIYQLGVHEMAETRSWIHFRNPNGLVFSCRKTLMSELDSASALDVDSIVNFSGQVTAFPKGLTAATERAQVFSATNSDGNLVTVELKNQKLRIKGRGVNGWYMEVTSCAYDGAECSFMIDPELLRLLTQYEQCEITEGRMKVEVGKFVYVTCLGTPEETKQDEPEPSAKKPKKSKKA